MSQFFIKQIIIQLFDEKMYMHYLSKDKMHPKKSTVLLLHMYGRRENKMAE